MILYWSFIIIISKVYQRPELILIAAPSEHDSGLILFYICYLLCLAWLRDALEEDEVVWRAEGYSMNTTEH